MYFYICSFSICMEKEVMVQRSGTSPKHYYSPVLRMTEARPFSVTSEKIYIRM